MVQGNTIEKGQILWRLAQVALDSIIDVQPLGDNNMNA